MGRSTIGGPALERRLAFVRQHDMAHLAFAKPDRHRHATKSPDDQTTSVAAGRGRCAWVSNDALWVQSISNSGPEWADFGHSAFAWRDRRSKFGPAEKGGRVITVSEHSEVRTHTTPENEGRVALDIGVADLRRSLP